MDSESRFKRFLIGLLFVLLAGITFGLIWFFAIGPGTLENTVGFGWYIFSFAAGLSMIVLPCTLPLAFVIVPLSMGKGAAKGFSMALAFGLGVAVTLSMYGILAAALGKVAIGSLGAPLEVVKNWLYFIAGGFAYLFALGELGLVKYRMPSYTGAFPGFIQKQQDILKALLLGLFLGNIGVGCPHPATPVILTRIAVAGDIFYGWILFFVHAVGRILPLLFLAILAILGVNALQGLVKRKEKIERATGWGMVFVAGFILVLGLFSHDWWVVSGQHTFLEELTQEERFLSIVSERLKVSAPHAHGPEEVAGKTGLFGLPLGLGTWVMLFLWILPLFWYYGKKKKETLAMTELPEKETRKRTLPYLFWNFVTLSLLLVLVFGYMLPNRFLAQAQMPHGEGMMEHMEDGKMTGGAAHDGHGATHYHEESEVKDGVLVEFSSIPQSPSVGQDVAFYFSPMLISCPRKGPEACPDTPPGIPPHNLEIQHEKKMHVIGVRRDLTEFFHIHPLPLLSAEPTLSADTISPDTGPFVPAPELSPEEREKLLSKTMVVVPPISGDGTLALNHVFPKPGEYKIWSEIKYKGENHVFGHPLLSVSGEGPTFDLQKEVTTSKIVDVYQVRIFYDHLHVGDNHLDFVINDFEGRRVELENYLGAQMHLSIISEDVSQFIHTHPGSGHNGAGNHLHGYLDYDYNDDHDNFALIKKALANGAETHERPTDEDHVAFAVTFPKAGFYKAFAEFRPKNANLPPDTALRAEFWLEVSAEAPAKPNPLLNSWWGRFIISVILILILGWGVRKYVTAPQPR